MGPNFKLVPGLLVDRRPLEDGCFPDVSRQRNRADHPGSGPLCRPDDLLDGLIQDSMIISPQPDSDFFFRGHKPSKLTCDNFLGNLFRNFGITMRLHGKSRPALREGADRRRIPKHLRERH